MQENYSKFSRERYLNCSCDIIFVSIASSRILRNSFYLDPSPWLVLDFKSPRIFSSSEFALTFGAAPPPDEHGTGPSRYDVHGQHTQIIKNDIPDGGCVIVENGR